MGMRSIGQWGSTRLWLSPEWEYRDHYRHQIQINYSSVWLPPSKLAVYTKDRERRSPAAGKVR